MKTRRITLTCLAAGIVTIIAACAGTQTGGTTPVPAATITIARAGGTPISPYAFGNNYYNWVDWAKNGQVALPGT
ncbi:MAG: hypothetical protein P8107_11160, partial [Spirochaetia bacterium]